MRTVRIAELKDHLAQYLRVVREGTRLIVMDRDRPIAEICPPPRNRRAAPNRRAELIRKGILIAAPRPTLRLDELGPPIGCRGDALSALRADRDAH
jgi:antitoxin (DNA-binding transcriptional repressor) of toxin-antitoxin stability system